MFSAPLPRRQGVLKTIRRDMRKYFHAGSAHHLDVNGATPNNTPAAGQPVALYLAALNAAEISPNFTLCAPNGDEKTGNWKCHPYLVTRQFRRGKKEAVA